MIHSWLSFYCCFDTLVEDLCLQGNSSDEKQKFIEAANGTQLLEPRPGLRAGKALPPPLGGSVVSCMSISLFVLTLLAGSSSGFDLSYVA